MQESESAKELSSRKEPLQFKIPAVVQKERGEGYKYELLWFI